MNNKQLTRNTEDQMLSGVCSGLANYLNVDPVLVRLAFVLMTLFHGSGLLFYIILAIIMPETGEPVAKANSFDDEEIVIK